MDLANIQTVKQRFGIIGNSEALNRAIDIAIQVAPTDLSVLITGESGVGKERFPQIIHSFSARKHGPYIAVNCGAIPEGTIASELFGHEKGAFTGAAGERKGYFETANEGTIFLDEVGELPLPIQTQLLRVLESGEFIRVGASKPQKTNVRVVAATNVNMQQAIAEGRFREDLYYRLCTVPINLPPLRERKQDIPLLFRKFSSDIAEKYKMPPLQLTDEARTVLCNYYWNGNIRQLKNVTEQIAVIEKNREITAETLRKYLPENEMGHMPVLLGKAQQGGKSFASEREILYEVLFDMKKDMNDLKKLVYNIINQNNISQEDLQVVKKYAEDLQHPVSIVTAPQKKDDAPIKVQHINPINHDADEVDFQVAEEYRENEASSEGETLQDMEKKMIKRVLEENHGRRNATAAALNISERTLYRKLKEYDLFQPRRKNNK